MTANQDRLAEAEVVEGEMVKIKCDECGQPAELSLSRNVSGPSTPDLEFRGIVTCSRDAHQWPVTIKTDNVIQSTAPAMPVSETQKLHDHVPEGLVEDLQEAERCHFANCLKASTVICRRALQLGFEDRGVTVPGNSKPTLGLLLAEARKAKSPLLKDDTFLLADGIKDIGDGGAHQRVTLDEREVSTLIYVSVRVLNELFQ